MRRFTEIMITLLVVMLVAQPMLAAAGSSTRIIPSGEVTVLENGKAVSQFRSEMPLTRDSLMLSSGNCVVQNQDLQLVAHDKSVFAVKQGAASNWDLTLKTGRVDFALRPTVKSVSYEIPSQTVQASLSKGSVGPNGLARGFIVVSDSGAELTMQEGSLEVSTSEGSQIAKPGQSIILTAATTDKKDETKKGAYVATGGAGGISGGAIAAGVAGLAAVGGIAGGIAASSGGGSTTTVSPF